MRRVVFNNKGGVGKSTIVCNLAAVSARRGKRTLVVDLDPQGNSTRYLLGAGADEAAPSLAKFFEETLSFKLFREDPTAFVHATPFPGLSLLPAHAEMADLHGKLESHHKIYKLRELLQRLPEFDSVYLDTPPAMGFYTLSALIAADRCLIPFDCDDFSRRALYALLDTRAGGQGRPQPRSRGRGDRRQPVPVARAAAAAPGRRARRRGAAGRQAVPVVVGEGARVAPGVPAADPPRAGPQARPPVRGTPRPAGAQGAPRGKRR